MTLPTPQLSLGVKTYDILSVWQEFEMLILDVSPICTFELDFSLDSTPKV